MVFSASVTTSKGGSKGSPQETVLRVARGLIWRLEVEFPPGCSGLVHCQIYDGAYQVYPASPGESFHSDGRVIGFDDLYLKEAAPYELRILTWNEDETWDHTLQVRVAMASSEAFMSRYMPSITWDKFSEAMAEASRRQEEEKAKAMEEAFRALGKTIEGM